MPAPDTATSPLENLVFAQVAVSVPLDQTFTYKIPDGWQEKIKLGQRVLVPFGGRRLTGHIVSMREAGEPNSEIALKKLKPLLELLDPEPFFGPKMLEFLLWISRYYHCPIGEVFRAATPSGINLESLKKVRLTELGKSNYDPTRMDTPDEQVLKILSEKGELPVQRLAKFARMPAAGLNRLQKKGWIEIDSKLQEVRVKIQTERLIHLKDDLPAGELEKLRGTKQKQILKILQEKGSLPLTGIESAVGKARQVVERLAEIGIVKIEHRETYRDIFGDIGTGEKSAVDFELTSDQEAALSPIVDALNREESQRFETFLLHGITGSGKTEIYLRAAQEAIRKNLSVILLVPEISLTPQMVERCFARFGRDIAVLHSALSDAERYDQWRRVVRGEVKIAIGARSVIFAPFSNLGLIIVDEEHEGSFKQETGLMYHARDLAVMRGRIQNATVVLGSATPSLESYFKAQSEKFRILELPARVGENPLPEVQIVDMTTAPIVYRSPSAATGRDALSSRKPIFSKALFEGIQGCLDRKEQAILFLNRRGYAPAFLCTACGKPVACPHCEISLTFYQRKQVLNCHYCDYTQPPATSCSACKGESLQQIGFGTESLETEAKFYFPDARFLRMDRDTTTQKGSHQKLLRELHEGNADILIGTQMVAKGHHFPNVTLVGVILADVAIHMPDFRASERAFQLLTQVAGRAGRGDRPGKVIVQTYNPEHPAIIYASTHDFHAFYAEEIEHRRQLGYPPFSRLVCFRFKCPDQQLGERSMLHIQKQTEQILSRQPELVEHLKILGPIPAPMSKIRNQFRWQLLIKGTQSKTLHRFAYQLRTMLSQDARLKTVQVQVDVDPLNLL